MTFWELENYVDQGFSTRGTIISIIKAGRSLNGISVVNIAGLLEALS